MTDKKTKDEKALTIFELVGNKQKMEAIQTLLTGKTPEKYILKRPARGGGMANYVNTYYMTRQASLVTGFRWSSKCLQEKYFPNEENPKEIGAQMEVTLMDGAGNIVSHISWGGKDVARYESGKIKVDKKGNQIKDAIGKPVYSYKAGDIISLFDDLKAAYSDGIKKCLSYFGIANDIYGSKDYESYAESEEESTPKKKFIKYVDDRGLMYADAFKTLGVESFSDITDFDEALKKLQLAIEGEKKDEKEADKST